MDVFLHCLPESTDTVPLPLPLPSSSSASVLPPCGHSPRCSPPPLWTNETSLRPKRPNILFCWSSGSFVSQSLGPVSKENCVFTKPGRLMLELSADLMIYNICGGWTSMTLSWNICNIKLNNWAACEADDGLRVKSGISHVQCLIPMCLIIKFNFCWRHGLPSPLHFYQFDLFDLFFNESPEPKASGSLANHWSCASSAAANGLGIWTAMHQCIIFEILTRE